VFHGKAAVVLFQGVSRQVPDPIEEERTSQLLKQRALDDLHVRELSQKPSKMLRRIATIMPHRVVPEVIALLVENGGAQSSSSRFQAGVHSSDEALIILQVFNDSVGNDEVESLVLREAVMLSHVTADAMDRNTGKALFGLL